MKKVFLSAFLLLSFTAFAQNKLIEVEVTDTITLRPLNFNVNVYLNDDDVSIAAYVEETGSEYDALAEKEKSRNRLQQLKSMLEGKKYKVNPLDESKVNPFDRKLYGRGGQEGFTIVVNGLQEVQKLKTMLEDSEDITTAVTVLKYADEQKAEELLIKKLIEKARVRVAVIALNSQMKAGKILEVREGKPTTEAGLSELYMQLTKMGMAQVYDADYNGSLSKTFVVKFAAE